MKTITRVDHQLLPLQTKSYQLIYGFALALLFGSLFLATSSYANQNAPINPTEDCRNSNLSEQNCREIIGNYHDCLNRESSPQFRESMQAHCAEENLEALYANAQDEGPTPSQPPSPEQGGQAASGNQCDIEIEPIRDIDTGRAYRYAGGGSPTVNLDDCFDWVGESREGGGEFPLANHASTLASEGHISPYADIINRMAQAQASGSSQGDDVTCPNRQDSLQSDLRNLARRYQNIQTCAALFNLIPAENIEDRDMASTMNLTRKSADDSIVCRSSGIVTLDYKKCTNLITINDGGRVAQVGLHTYQGMDMDSTLHNARMDMQQSEDDGTGALRAQQTGLEKGAQQSNQRAAFHGTKGGLTWATSNSMPTREDVYEECLTTNFTRDYRGITDNFYKVLEEHIAGEAGRAAASELKQSIESSQGGSDRRAVDQACKRLVSGDGIPQVIMNDQARERGIASTMEEAVQAGLSLAEALMLAKQADKVGDSIEKVEDFEPEPPPVQYDELMMTLCEHDPSAPECLPESSRENVARAGDEFTFGGFNGATTGPRLDEFNAPDERGATGGPTDRDPVAPIGSKITSIDNPSGIGATPAAGSLERGGGAGGGGGGPGVGGAGAPAGGGARGHDAEGKGNGGRAQAAGNNPTFDGGRGFALGGGGGLNRARRNNDRAENPFANLFGEDGRRSGEVLNYRNPAELGDENGSLFNMISTRYRNVTENDRLMHYDAR